jgi:hypothetical protein
MSDAIARDGRSVEARGLPLVFAFAGVPAIYCLPVSVRPKRLDADFSPR